MKTYECPNNIEELENLEQLIPMCRKELYKQAQARIESGAAKNISDASKQLSEEAGKNAESIRKSIQREIGTLSQPDVSNSNDTEIVNKRDEQGKFVDYAGPGRPIKFALIDDEMEKEIYKKLKNEKQEEKKQKLEEYHEKESQLKDISNIVIDNIDDFYKLYNCDLLSAPIDDGSLDVIITDPPYPKEFLDCWNKLASFAAAKLKEGGVLVAMSGQSYLPEVYKRMTIEGLNYYWTCCIKLTVSPDLRQKRLHTQWKPLLFYVKGDYNKTFLKSDVYDNLQYNDTRDGQTYHKWGQSYTLMKKIIEDFSYTDDLICDPFMGGGTTILAGLELKRKMIGIDIDTNAYNTTKERLNNVKQSNK